MLWSILFIVGLRKDVDLDMRDFMDIILYVECGGFCNFVVMVMWVGFNLVRYVYFFLYVNN